MTTGKPPQPPPKTLLGGPAEAQAAVEKLRAQRQGQVPPAAAPAPDLSRTLFGNPHAAPSSPASARPPSSAVPPKLPQSQPFVPPPLPPRSQPAQAVQVQPPAGMNRPQYGAHADLEAAARQAREVVAASEPASQRPAPGQATQYSPRPGLGASPQAAVPRAGYGDAGPANPAANVAVRPNQTVMLKDSAQPSAAASSRPAAQGTGVASAAPAAPATWAQPQPASAPVATSLPPSAAAASAPPQAVVSAPPQAVVSAPPQAARQASGQFIATEPDRERDSQRPAAVPQPGVPSVRLSPNASLSLPPAPGHNPMQATRLVSFEAGALPPSSTANGAPSPLSGTPQLSLSPEDTSARKVTPVRRWPALSLLGIAVLAFGGVIVVRAPGLLPPELVPYAFMISNLVEHYFPGSVAPPPAAGPSTEPQAITPAADPTAAQALPGAAAQPDAPLQPTASPEAAAQLGAAPVAPTDPAPAAAPLVAASQPVAPPTAAGVVVSAAAVPATVGAAPSALHGSSAELEKQAIELLLANDYPAARAVYERLRAAEPTRPEYGVMLELLMREITPSCGGEGQVPCPQ